MSADGASNTALALTTDLTIEAPLSAASERAGVRLEVYSSVDALLAKVANSQPRIVILDLSHAGLLPAELVSRLKEALPPGAKIVAFAPHVHRQRLAQATEAGCDLVISRGQFHAQMTEIFRPAAN